MPEDVSIVKKAETVWDDLRDLWRRRKVLCIAIVLVLFAPTLFGAYQQFVAIPRLKAELDRQKSAIKLRDSQIHDLKGERDKLDMKLTTVQAAADRTFPDRKEEERLGLLLSLLERVGDTYDVKSENQSGGITAGKVDIKVNPEKPKLVLATDKTKVQIVDGVYEKMFYFRNPEGKALQRVRLKLTFDEEFISVKGDKWVWTGMIVGGGERTQPGQGGKSVDFYTEVLEPIAFIEVMVTSKHDIQITRVESNSQ